MKDVFLFDVLMRTFLFYVLMPTFLFDMLMPTFIFDVLVPTFLFANENSTEYDYGASYDENSCG